MTRPVGVPYSVMAGPTGPALPASRQSDPAIHVYRCTQGVDHRVKPGDDDFRTALAGYGRGLAKSVNPRRGVTLSPHPSLQGKG